MAGDAHADLVQEAADGNEITSLDDVNASADAHDEVEAEAPVLENADVEREGEEKAEEEEEEDSSISSLSEPSGGDDLGACAVDPVADSEMVGNGNGRTNAASSCGRIGIPMTPGLSPLTPELVTVPPPADVHT